MPHNFYSQFHRHVNKQLLEKVIFLPKEKILSKLANNNPNGINMKVPSLSDIQGALARLKKVDIDQDSSDS